MPPVFGPVSPSPTRLKSWAGSNGTAACPSVTTNSDTSGPSRNSSTTTVSQASAWASAWSRSVVTTTPLPAASPSSFTTYGGPNSSSARSTSAGSRQTNDRAVGTPATAITSLANAFDPSIRAACWDGPKQAMPAARTCIGHAGHQRCLRPDHDQVRLLLERERGHRGPVKHVHIGQLGHLGDPGVARRHDHRVHGRVGGQRPRQRVLTATRPDHQHPHAANLSNSPPIMKLTS